MMLAMILALELAAAKRRPPRPAPPPAPTVTTPPKVTVPPKVTTPAALPPPPQARPQPPAPIIIDQPQPVQAHAAASSEEPALVIDVEVGVRLFHRQLSLSQDEFGQFYPHTHSLAIAPAGKLRYFPGAHFSNGIASWFGIYVHGNVAPGLRARLPDNSTLNITAFEAGGGIVAKYGVRRFEVLLELGAVVQQWSFGSAPPAVLSVSYVAFRPALEGRVHIVEHFALRASVDLRVVLANAPITAAFPRAKGLGFRATFGAAIPIAHGFEVRADGEFLQYGYAMNSQPGDTNVLGGYTDQYFGGIISAAFRR